MKRSTMEHAWLEESNLHFPVSENLFILSYISDFCWHFKTNIGPGFEPTTNLISMFLNLYATVLPGNQKL